MTVIILFLCVQFQYWPSIDDDDDDDDNVWKKRHWPSIQIEKSQAVLLWPFMNRYCYYRIRDFSSLNHIVFFNRWTSSKTCLLVLSSSVWILREHHNCSFDHCRFKLFNTTACSEWSLNRIYVWIVRIENKFLYQSLLNNSFIFK